MSTCNYKTLGQTGNSDPTPGIIMTPQWGGPGFDLGVPNCPGGFTTLNKAYSNNGNACNNGYFVKGLCGGNKVIKENYGRPMCRRFQYRS